MSERQWSETADGTPFLPDDPRPAIEALRVHQFQPGDRLIVRIRDQPECFYREQWPAYRDALVRWSGLPPDHIVALTGDVEIEVARGLPSDTPG